MVTFEIAPGRFDGILDRLGSIVDRTTDVAFMAVPGAPDRPGLAFLDGYRVPNTSFSVIVLMDFLYRHRTSFRLDLTSRRTRARTSHSSPFAVHGLQFGSGQRIGTLVCAHEHSKNGTYAAVRDRWPATVNREHQSVS
jgi:hypothetical protein